MSTKDKDAFLNQAAFKKSKCVKEDLARKKLL